jgi:hypothetical protein
MTHNLLFHLALTFILLHEMDAVRCKEWRIFPGLSLLNDFWGFRIFVLAHIPLFYFLFWQLVQPNNESFIKGLDIFFIVHVGLHLLFLMRKKNKFKDGVSWIIISGAGMFGLLDLVL